MKTGWMKLVPDLHRTPGANPFFFLLNNTFFYSNSQQEQQEEKKKEKRNFPYSKLLVKNMWYAFQFFQTVFFSCFVLENEGKCYICNGKCYDFYCIIS